MKLHEYQAKAILRKYGVPVPDGDIATTAQEAQAITQRLGGHSVIKAQVHAGGRGKAGGIQVANSPEEAYQITEHLVGSTLVTFQTGQHGAPVHQVLVEAPLEIDREMYFSITTDGTTRRPVVIASAAGGMEIEELATQHPEKLHRAIVDPVIGLQPFQGRSLAYEIGLHGKLASDFAVIAEKCYKVFVSNDCSMLEINPLTLSKAGELLALDAKINLDDDALFRHPDLAELRDPQQEDPLEREARKYKVAYVKLDGDVGCMVNGAGLAMATMDIIKTAGSKPANFLDVGGGANAEKVEQAFSIILEDSNVKRVLVNIFGGIQRCDVTATGIVAACTKRKVSVPIVVRMLGTNVEEGRRILQTSGLGITLATTLPEVAQFIAKTVVPAHTPSSIGKKDS